MTPEHSRAVKSGKTLEVWLYSNPVASKKVAVNKKRRSAPVRFERSSKRSARNFAYLVRENLVGTDLPQMITLTFERDITDVKQAYLGYTRFVQNMRYRFDDFRMITVVEFQDLKRGGVVHFHSLVWDLDVDLEKIHKLDWKRLRKVGREKDHICDLCKCWMYGFVYVKHCYNNHEKIVSYLVKYLRKSHGDQRLAGVKAYSATRNCKRPSFLKGNTQVSYVKELYGIDVMDVSSASRVFEYRSEWFGKTRYLKFELSTEKPSGEWFDEADMISSEVKEGLQSA